MSRVWLWLAAIRLAIAPGNSVSAAARIETRTACILFNGTSLSRSAGGAPHEAPCGPLLPTSRPGEANAGPEAPGPLDSRGRSGSEGVPFRVAHSPRIQADARRDSSRFESSWWSVPRLHVLLSLSR